MRDTRNINTLKEWDDNPRDIKPDDFDRLKEQIQTLGQYKPLLLDACRNLIEFTDGGIYICMSSSELGTLRSAFEEAGGHWQTFIMWIKNTFTLSRADYQHIYEPILYGWVDKHDHFFVTDRNNPNVWEDLHEVKSEYDPKNDETTIKFQGFEMRIKGKAEGMLRRRKVETDIWRYDKPSRSEEHPTMKPVRLCAQAIRNSSKVGDIVLDLFGGSGSTLIACEKTDRSCYMMELDPHFCDVIRKRYDQSIKKTS